MRVMTEREIDQVSGALRSVWSYMLDGAGAGSMIGSYAEPGVGTAIGALAGLGIGAGVSL